MVMVYVVMAHIVLAYIVIARVVMALRRGQPTYIARDVAEVVDRPREVSVCAMVSEQDVRARGFPFFFGAHADGPRRGGRGPIRGRRRKGLDEMPPSESVLASEIKQKKKRWFPRVDRNGLGWDASDGVPQMALGCGGRAASARSIQGGRRETRSTPFFFRDRNDDTEPARLVEIARNHHRHAERARTSPLHNRRWSYL